MSLPKDSQYSFCETITTGSTTPWHIRQLTEKGQKFGGGADTLSLCGREVSWDINCEIFREHSKCCKKCACLLPLDN